MFIKIAVTKQSFNYLLVAIKFHCFQQWQKIASHCTMQCDHLCQFKFNACSSRCLGSSIRNTDEIEVIWRIIWKWQKQFFSVCLWHCFKFPMQVSEDESLSMTKWHFFLEQICKIQRYRATTFNLDIVEEKMENWQWSVYPDLLLDQGNCM